MPTIIPIPYAENGEQLFYQLADLPYACWLDSGKPYSTYGRYDIISALPAKRVIADKQTCEIIHYSEEGFNITHKDNIREDPIKALEDLLSALDQDEATDTPFAGGAIGYFSYDLGKRYIPLNNSKHLPCSGPELDVGIYLWALIQDHHLKRSYIAHLAECSSDTLSLVKHRLTSEPVQAPSVDVAIPPFKSDQNYSTYMNKIEQIHDYILAGDCYQVNFAQCFTSQFEGSPYQAYKQLRSRMASPYSAYLSFGEQSILSLSPERFLKVEQQHVTTQPIKGTITRNKQPSIDQQQAERLLASEKDRAENLMIVDLLRNDLGKHCIPGSIQVDKLFDVESFPNVHHLVSTITGTLPSGTHCLTLFKDCFPGGSITGAPKKRAMEIIEELESQSRGVYCGSIGYINHQGDMDTNIAIRTLQIQDKEVKCWGGGGIVADSVAEDEYRESIDKVGKLITAFS